jgi:hypothetical protein
MFNTLVGKEKKPNWAPRIPLKKLLSLDAKGALTLFI